MKHSSLNPRNRSEMVNALIFLVLVNIAGLIWYFFDGYYRQ